MRGPLIALLFAAPGALAQPVFEDRSAALPGGHAYGGGWEHFVGGGVAVFDCNGDERPDIVAAGGDTPARLFVNATPAPGDALRFEAGRIDPLTGVTGAYPLDIDSDGVLDLAVLRVGRNRLLQGDGACGFRDAGPGWGFDGGNDWTTAFSATWDAEARWPLLAIGNYVDRDDPEGPFGACEDNALYRPGPGGYRAPEPLSPGFCALSMLFSDWRRQGRPDLRISNDRHYYLRGGSEQMWQLSPLRLLGPEDGWDPVSIWGMGIASADITGDGLPEVMLTSMGDQLLMLNRGDGYDRAPYDIGSYAQRPHTGDDGRPSTGWHAEFGDIDNDGRADLFIAKGNVDQMPSNAIRDPNNLLMQGADGRFAEASVAAGIATLERSRGAALADLDGDGLLDLVVVNRRAPMELWQNRSRGTGHWLAVEPRQAGANTRAVGAWVEVRTAERVQAQEITVGGGHAGGKALPLHFGLGDAAAAEVRVIWPDGAATAWQTLQPNRRHRITRDR